MNMWIEQVTIHGIIISDLLIKEKGYQFAKKFSIFKESLTFSNGWVTKYKKRNRLRKIIKFIDNGFCIQNRKVLLLADHALSYISSKQNDTNDTKEFKEPEVSEGPKVPKEPEVPKGPEVPEGPEVSEGPEVLEEPETPKEPKELEEPKKLFQERSPEEGPEEGFEEGPKKGSEKGSEE
ncbi:35665_t:CDS:2, partial [Gigaspora margarita]